jgi:hypothetical protein
VVCFYVWEIWWDLKVKNATVQWTVARDGLTERTSIFTHGENANKSLLLHQKTTPNQPVGDCFLGSGFERPALQMAM